MLVIRGRVWHNAHFLTSGAVFFQKRRLLLVLVPLRPSRSLVLGFAAFSRQCGRNDDCVLKPSGPTRASTARWSGSARGPAVRLCFPPCVRGSRFLPACRPFIGVVACSGSVFAGSACASLRHLAGIVGYFGPASFVEAVTNGAMAHATVRAGVSCEADDTAETSAAKARFP